jgi:hypothetical protein
LTGFVLPQHQQRTVAFSRVASPLFAIEDLEAKLLGNEQWTIVVKVRPRELELDRFSDMGGGGGG